MALFFFKFANGGDESPETTLDLPSPEDAWAQATMTAGQMLRDLGAKFQPGTELQIMVADDSRRPLFSVRIVGEIYE